MTGFIRDAKYREHGIVGKIQCVGCGTITGTNVQTSGGWAYTCRCGANMSVMDGVITWPASFIRALAEGKEPAHLEWYVGWSNFMDERKQEIIRQMKLGGSTSVKDCKECIEKMPERIAKLKEAIKDEITERMDALQLAVHFGVPFDTAREIRKELRK